MDDTWHPVGTGNTLGDTPPPLGALLYLTGWSWERIAGPPHLVRRDVSNIGWLGAVEGTQQYWNLLQPVPQGSWSITGWKIVPTASPPPYALTSAAQTSAA